MGATISRIQNDSIFVVVGREIFRLRGIMLRCSLKISCIYRRSLDLKIHAHTHMETDLSTTKGIPSCQVC